MYGDGIDEPSVMYADTDGDHRSERFYFLADDAGNVYQLRDHAGVPVEQYEYGDFGWPVDPFTLLPIVGDPSSIGNPYLFTGRSYDAETGLYWYRTRYLDPVAGRFTSRDTIGPWGDPVELGNAYAYVGNNPWTWVDPFGLTPRIESYYKWRDTLTPEERWEADKGALFGCSLGIAGVAGIHVAVRARAIVPFIKQSAPRIRKITIEVKEKAARKIRQIKTWLDEKVHPRKLRKIEAPKPPKPPKWNESWRWEPPSGDAPGNWRWWDPKGGEWRFHRPDRWHPQGHWDYNPWDAWNSPWQNIF